jgi:hypothetical protein
MTSKVEELRAKLLQSDRRNVYDNYGRVKGCEETAHIPTAAEIDSLIAAARAEGVAEERERIRGNSQMVGVESDHINFIGGVDYVGSAFLVPVDVMDPPSKVGQ